MLKKLNLFGKGQSVETNKAVKEMEISVEAVMDELVQNGEVIEEVEFMESLALDTMKTLKDVPVYFNKIMKAKPEDVYQEVTHVLNQLRYVSRANDKINREKLRELRASYRELEQEINTKSEQIKHKIKVFFSVLLYEAGSLLIKTGTFAIETTGIITVFAIRMVGHLGKETRWACQEIGKSFNRNLIQPYKTK